MEDTYAICIYSFNSRGFSDDKHDICRLFMLENENFVPILCNQENFLQLNNGYRVKQALPDCHIFFKKGEMDTIQGRPKNGMFIAVPNKIKENVFEVSPHHLENSSSYHQHIKQQGFDYQYLLPDSSENK